MRSVLITASSSATLPRGPEAETSALPSTMVSAAPPRAAFTPSTFTGAFKSGMVWSEEIKVSCNLVSSSGTLPFPPNNDPKNEKRPACAWGSGYILAMTPTKKRTMTLLRAYRTTHDRGGATPFRAEALLREKREAKSGFFGCL